MSFSNITTAAEMARHAGVDPKRFRAALRDAQLLWHPYDSRWEVVIGSLEHGDMVRILSLLGAKRPSAVRTVADRSPFRAAPSAARDETYMIDLCDEVLGQEALRQHCFSFLLGDPGVSGRRAALPVDAFYPALNLVVEYHERQHTERVGFFDDRPTVSGVGRGEQRRRYDDYRRTLLPQHGYDLVCFTYGDFAHSSSKRLRRTAFDRAIVESRLGRYLQASRP
jgi:hypothetical protein